MAAEHGAALELMHAHVSPPLQVLERIGVRPATAKKLEAGAKKQLAGQAARLRKLGVAVEARLVPGGPLACIEQAVETSSVDLVVVGARGHRSVRNTVLGTTASRVLDRVAADVLAVRQDPRTSYGRVLVCIDDDPVASSVLQSARQLFPQAHLRVLHAYEPLFEQKMRYAGVTDAQIREHRRETRSEAQRAIAEIIERAQVPIRSADVMIRLGYPPNVIPRIAARLGIEVIALGVAHGPVARRLLGSVSKRVLREASCDVAILGRPRSS